MLSATLLITFAACYAVALALELVRLKHGPFAWHQPAMVTVTLAGVTLHTVYVAQRAGQTNAAPLSSPADWLLLAAWVLAVVYLMGMLYLPRAATGLVLLPIIFVLIVASLGASQQPFAPERASRFWGNLHGSVLLLGAVSVCIGFAAGLMYLAQSYLLKHRKPPTDAVRLPSLEWLERINTNALAVSVFLIGLGFASGVVLAVRKHRGEANDGLWSDPVVLSLGAMLLYLVAAEIFRVVYPAARRGRKVAYLTLASFGFLVIALASMLFVDNVHGTPTPAGDGGLIRLQSSTSGHVHQPKMNPGPFAPPPINQLARLKLLPPTDWSLQRSVPTAARRATTVSSGRAVPAGANPTFGRDNPRLVRMVVGQPAWRAVMHTAKFVYWEEDGMILGPFLDYPDYWTQGTTLEDLKEHLRDLYADLTSGDIPGIRKVDERFVS